MQMLLRKSKFELANCGAERERDGKETNSRTWARPFDVSCGLGATKLQLSVRLPPLTNSHTSFFPP